MESGLKIGFWNINVLSEENVTDEAFKRQIYKHDILLLYDTWLRKEIINNLSHPNGYLCRFVVKIKRLRKVVHQRRIPGYFHSKLNKELSVFDKSNQSILWIKTGKNS